MLDSLLDGRRFRVLTVVDIFSRHSPILQADLSLTGLKVAAALDRAAKPYSYPQIIQVDNGSEFQSKVLDAWAYKHKVKLDFIRRGKPVDNCFIESFNARLRDECLNTNVFTSLADARRKIEPWRIEYNESRPHMAHKTKCQQTDSPCITDGVAIPATTAATRAAQLEGVSPGTPGSES